MEAGYEFSLFSTFLLQQHLTPIYVSPSKAW